MPRNFGAFVTQQVFLNYPFDIEYLPLSVAMHFAVVAGGLLPVCAHDLSVPDRPRIDALVEAIHSCHYSVHDLSRARGEGAENFTRMNMPIEMGMALFYAFDTQRAAHRCAFFVPTEHEYQAFASDLSGLDPVIHRNDAAELLRGMYEWLRKVVPSDLFNNRPTVDVLAKFEEFKEQMARIRGSSATGHPSHGETSELMYRICEKCGWWDWRENRAGKALFPEVPIAFFPSSLSL